MVKLALSAASAFLWPEDQLEQSNCLIVLHSRLLLLLIFVVPKV
jgi:hypothetical protein